MEMKEMKESRVPAWKMEDKGEIQWKMEDRMELDGAQKESGKEKLGGGER